MDVLREEDNDEPYQQLHLDPTESRNQRTFPILQAESRRLNVAFSLFKAYFIQGFVLQLIAIALDASTDNRIIFHSSYTSLQPKQNYWEANEIELALTAFQVGFLFSLFGGFLAQKLGGAKVFAVSMFLTSGMLLLNIIFIFADSYRAYLLSLGLVGVFQSLCLVSTTEIFGSWIPKQERTAVMVWVITGIYFGAGVTQYLNYFCNYFIDLPWYIYLLVSSGLCFTCGHDWWLDMKNLPTEDEKMCDQELVYILQNTITTMKKRDIKTIKDIATSSPCWALFTVEYALGWASAFALTYSPVSFLRDTYNTLRDNETEDFLFIIPIANSVDFFIVPLIGSGIAFWQSKSHLKPTKIYKIIISVTYTIAAIFFIFLAVFTNHLDHLGSSYLCLAVIKAMLSLSYVIFQIIIINLAPNHSSILSGLALFWHTVGAMFVQLVCRYANQNHEVEKWGICFFSSGVTLLLSIAVYVVLGSSKPQMWSMLRQLDTDENPRAQCLELINVSNDR